MKYAVCGIAVIAAMLSACAPEPVRQGKSYYQREAEKQVSADDPAKPQRLGADEFRNVSRQDNPHNYGKDVDDAVSPHKYQIWSIINRTARQASGG